MEGPLSPSIQKEISPLIGKWNRCFQSLSSNDYYQPIVLVKERWKCILSLLLYLNVPFTNRINLFLAPWYPTFEMNPCMLVSGQSVIFSMAIALRFLETFEPNIWEIKFNWRCSFDRDDSDETIAVLRSGLWDPAYSLEWIYLWTLPQIVYLFARELNSVIKDTVVLQ